MIPELQQAIQLRTQRHYSEKELLMILDMADLVAEKGDSTTLLDLAKIEWEDEARRIDQAPPVTTMYTNGRLVINEAPSASIH